MLQLIEKLEEDRRLVGREIVLVVFRQMLKVTGSQWIEFCNNWNVKQTETIIDLQMMVLSNVKTYFRPQIDYTALCNMYWSSALQLGLTIWSRRFADEVTKS